MATEITIAPSAGNAPFPTQGGVGATPGFDAIDYRRFWSRSYAEGVASAAAWRVTEAALGANATVEVAANLDAAFVQGDTVADQGLYYVAPHSVVAALDVPAADPSNPRVDRVVLQVRDNEHDGSGFSDARLMVLAGTPTAGATKYNAAGAVLQPDTALMLAQYVVPAGSTVITNAEILDFREYGLLDGQVGEVRTFFNDVLPDGWLDCDHAAYRRDQFARLFGEIGTVGGGGDGTNTFNVPDARGRSIIGRDVNSGGVTRTPGQTGGATTHTLTVGEMPSHSHDVLGEQSDNLGSNVDLTKGAGTMQSGRLSSTGGGAAHNNMPPFIVGRVAIFAGSVAAAG